MAGPVWKVGDLIMLRFEYHQRQREGKHPAPSTDALEVVEAGNNHSTTSQTVRFATGSWCWSAHFELAGGPW